MEDTSLQLTLNENHESGVSIEHNENVIQRRPLLRSLSEGESIAERSLITDNSDWAVNPKIKIPFFNNCLCHLDEFVATPIFNIDVIENACDQDFNFFDAVNESNYVGGIDGAMASLSLFAISIGIYVINYCKLREIEQNSNYFYFCRLFKACDVNKIKNKMGEIEQDNDDAEDPITFEVLQAVVKFYPPDISKIACWMRRFFASKIEREQLKVLGCVVN